MNTRAIRWLLGSLCLLLAAALLAPAGVSALFREWSIARGFALSSALAGAAGGALVLANRGALETREGRPAFFRREGLATVALAWVLASVVGALPFLLCGTTSSPVDALFESTSGFTTTGSSVFSGDAIDAMPQGIVFWRALTHWIGGIGIVLVFVAIMPVGGRSLFRSEGLRESNQSRVRDSALSLLRVYVALTTLHALLLWAAGVSVFDAVLHAFSSMATGGFSNHGASAAWFASPLVEAILIAFMIAAGTNFALWDDVWRRGREGLAAAARSTELRVYLALIGSVSLFIALRLWFWGGSNGDAGSDLPDYRGFLTCVRDATFSLVSVQTCTGYATADFDRWPDVCRVMLMAAASVGGCAGSTAGGIKVVRLVIVARASLAAVRAFARPRAIEQVRLDDQVVPDATIVAATRYFVLWFLVAIGGVVLLLLFGVDATSAISGTIANLNNVGPGLGSVGPALNYGGLSAAAKLVTCLLMILGRLEFFALIALVLPGFWRR
jgi:trk system potassium uptake protein TrkH